MSSDPRYPIGKWNRQPSVTADECATMIDQIAAAPAELAAAARGLTDAQLDTPYRDGGWTVRQVVHHVADSHMNAYVRFKLGVTEESPTIKPYIEGLWAETIDGRTGPIDVSLAILDGVHRRWVRFMRTFDAGTFARTLMHPEYGPMTLSDLLQMYAWHGRHHTAHIMVLRERHGW
jgi:uncharacterized damage-inducible protein DinB